MRCAIGRLSPVVILVAGLLAAGCGSTSTGSGGSLPSRTATVSARPSVTAAPTSQPPAHSATASAPTAPSTVSATSSTSSGTDLIWLWVLLGVLVVAGLIVLIARSARRRSAASADWRSRLIEAYAKGSALHDAMSVAEAPGGLAAADAAARWFDIQRRADDLAQTLYALRGAAPQDSADRARVDNTLASLQAVRSAMDAERARGGVDPGQAEVVRSRLASFESSLRALGAPEQYPSPSRLSRANISQARCPAAIRAAGPRAGVSRASPPSRTRSPSACCFRRSRSRYQPRLPRRRLAWPPASPSRPARR